MSDTFINIGLTILSFVCLAWWWFIAKEATSRKYILLLGICWLVAGITYIIGDVFNVAPLMGVCLLAFIGANYFFIKAIISERKAKKKSLHD